MGLFGLFNKPEPLPKPGRHVIHERNMSVYLDDDYATMGMREGWLINNGWHYDEHGNLVYTYEHRA